MPSIQILSQVAFYDYLAAELKLKTVPLPDESPWSAGLDSSLLVELVFAIEDLGVDIAEKLDWGSATFGDLYKTYTLEASMIATGLN